MHKLETIRHLERLSYRAWPAAQVRDCDGWRFRFSDGVTHRANSVWPNVAGSMLSLQQKIGAAHAFYAEKDRPTIFQLCPAAEPAELDRVLEQQGFSRGRDTTVQVAPVGQVLSAVGDVRFPVTLSSVCEGRWLAVYDTVESVRPHESRQRAEIMQAIKPRAAYAIAWHGEVPCAVGSAVCEDGWVGIFNLATATPLRRQGAARAVTQALLTWAIRHGAEDAYLQVMNVNSAALRLYHRLGFTTLYNYHYRSRPPLDMERRLVDEHRDADRTGSLHAFTRRPG